MPVETLKRPIISGVRGMITGHRGKAFKINAFHVFCCLLQAQIVPDMLNTLDGARSRFTAARSRM